MSDFQTIFSISQLNRLVRQKLEREFPLCWVSGEISNLTRAASGHLYFTLKDDQAQVRCIMFRMRAQMVPWRLENGQQVEAHVLVSLYEPRGDFQLTVENVRRAGLGRLFEEFLRLKEKLQRTGLLAPERKRPLPRFPRQIGIVSSPQAAALRDVLVTLQRRAPHLSIILYPTPVQGDAAANSVVQALTIAGQRNECDVLLLVRGGGSIEDLWAFNQENVAQAIAHSPLPIITGIGHETDTTIADFVADMRAATPTAAAELVTQGLHEIAEKLAIIARALHANIIYRIAQEQQRLDIYTLRLIDPATHIRQGHERLTLLRIRLDTLITHCLGDRKAKMAALRMHLSRHAPQTALLHSKLSGLAQRLQSAMADVRQRHVHTLDTLTKALEHLNPHAIQARGFAIIHTLDGKLVDSIDKLNADMLIKVELRDGAAVSKIIETHPGKSAID
jgi:exodeoxyribonuclease VII large subunit